MELAQYQKELVEYLSHTPGNIFVIIDMGMGKTIGTLSYIGNRNNVLIVAPPTVVKNAWEQDTVKLDLDSFSNIRETGAITGRDIIDYYHLKKVFKKLPRYDLVVFDEVTYCKSPSSDIWKACNNIRANRKIGLTATPIHTNLANAFGLIKLFHVDRVKSYSSFVSYFYNQVNPDRRSSTLERKFFRYLGVNGEYRYARYGWENELAEYFKPCFVRLKNKSNINYHIKQLEPTKEMIIKRREIIDCESSSYARSEIFRLAAEDGVKLECLKGMLERVKGKKVVFISRTFTVNLIKHAFPSLPILTANTTFENRQELIRNFENSTNGNEILIASVKCLSHGINLNAASTAIFFDMAPDYETFDQAVNRIHRKGKTDDVHIVQLVCFREEKDRFSYYMERNLKEFYDRASC